jgi:predicted metal-binding membrane protein
MTGFSLGMPRRDRLILIAALFGITLLAWIYTFYLASIMPGMDMDLAQMSMPRARPWQLADLGFNSLMWAVMMVAMMTPTATPMILTFAYVARQRAGNNSSARTTALFIMAYLIIWLTFSLAATLLQWGLHSALLLPGHMIAVSPSLGAILLLLAGLYQFTPLKRVCLVRCRTPHSFIITEWRADSKGAFIMGLRHGAFCTGCCWMLMLLLFVAGVMNLLWVALLAIIVLVEKVVPAGHWLGRAAGLLSIAWGITILITVI